MTRGGRGAAVLGALVLGASPVRAQAPLPGRVEVAAGALWVARQAMGSTDASETSADGTRFRLFASDSSLAAGVGIEGRIGVRLTRVLQLDASATYAKLELRSRITSDVEGIPDITLTEAVTQWTVEGAVVAHLARWRLGASGVPFLSAGAGYLRELHEGGTLAETGRRYHVGGGINYLLTRRDERRLKSTGLRVDARAVLRTGGVSFTDGAQVAPALGASLFLRF